MGGTSSEEQEESLVALLSTAGELFRLLPSVLARGRELNVQLQDPQVQWYVDNSHRALVLWLILAENGMNPCPRVATSVLEAADPSESSYGAG